MLDVTLMKAYVHDGRLSVVPFHVTDEGKKPAVGEGPGVLDPYRTGFPTDTELDRWFSPTPTGEGHSYVGLVCGAISKGKDLPVGGLELLDFDTKNDRGNRDLLRLFDDDVETRAPGLLKRLVIEKSRSGGRHIYYRCSTIQGNQKLARLLKENVGKNDKDKFVTLIETRGEGGFAVCAPSEGYSLVQGDIQAIPVVTPAERAILFEVARSFNECNDDGKIEAVTYARKSDADVRKAMDDYNERGDIRPILEKHGWTFMKQTRPTRVPGIREYILCRPGVTHGSATFNGTYLYPFSSNADPFSAEKPYTKAAVFAYLECGKNFKEAARQLKQLGYGQQRTKVVAQTFLSHLYQFRKNVVTTKYEYRRLLDGSWEELPGDIYHQFCMEVIKECDIEMDARSIRTPIISLALQNPYDPFVEYFTKQLPPWDGHDYIGELARTVQLTSAGKACGIAGCSTEQEFFAESLKRWLMALVATAIRYHGERQISNQSVLVLIGKQGRKKTTWLRNLISLPHSAEYIYEQTIDPHNKDHMLNLSSKILICPEELSNKYDIKEFKKFITSEASNERKAYDYESETRVRRASIACSGNEMEFLPDHTGNRRWLCFRVESVNEKHTVNMHMVYAQVMELLRTGAQYWFDEADEISKRNLMFRANTDEFEWLAEFFETKTDEVEGKWMQPMRIADEIEKMTGKTCNRVKLGFALTELGATVSFDSTGRKTYLVKQKAFPSGPLASMGYNLAGASRRSVSRPGQLEYYKEE